jgi:hypothetical protein
LNFRSLDIRVFCSLLAVLFTGSGQLPGQQAQPQPQPPQSAPASKPATPDYPDPRGFTIGISYWVTSIGSGPDLIGGKQSPDYATLTGLGKPKTSPGAEISFPISRTGSLHVEYFRTLGDGNQTLSRDSDLFANQFYKGDYLSTQYKIQSVKFYLDDLLYPHSFPVARFRLKSLWEIQYVSIKSSIDAPLAPTTDSSGNAISTTGQGSRRAVLPTFGLAAEYAMTPHVLFRVDATGFGLRHRSEIWDAEAVIAWRRRHFEILGGAKAFHFKTSPNNTEYLSSTVNGAFVGLRWHL